MVGYCLALVFAASPILAAEKPLRLSGGPATEEALRRFVYEEPVLQEKISEASVRIRTVAMRGKERDLRDALTDPAPGLLGPLQSCETLAECRSPDLAAEVPEAELIPEALRAMVRPWILLQNARGSEVVMNSIPGDTDAALRLQLKRSSAQPLILHISPRQVGGYKVWFERPLVLAEFYGRERELALSR